MLIGSFIYFFLSCIAFFSLNSKNTRIDRTERTYMARWMIRRDMPEVLDIDFLHYGMDYWKEEKYIEMLRSHKCVGIVTEQHEVITSAAVYELKKQSLIIIRWCTHPEYPHARDELFGKLKNGLSSQRRTRLFFKIPEDDLFTQVYLREKGASCIKVVGNTYVFKYEYKNEKVPNNC